MNLTKPAKPVSSRGLLDTSVIIDLGRVTADKLPAELAISALTLAELAAGPHATDDAAERARRQERLQQRSGLRVGELYRGLMVQALWVAVFVCLRWLLWRQGLKRYGAVGA